MDNVRLATWGVVVSVCVLGIFYPNALLWGVTLSAGGLGWIAGWFVASWAAVLRFFGAAIIITLIMSVWCAQRARRTVLQTGIIAGVQRWNTNSYAMSIIIREMRAVVVAVLLELLLPIVLLLAFTALIEAVVNLLDIETEWEAVASTILSATSKVWSYSPADLHREILNALAPFKSPAQKMLEKGIVVITGTISISFSLLLFLFRRRSTHLNAAQVIFEEIDLIVKEGFQSVPLILANQTNLANRPRGQLLIGASSDRQFLLLDPGTGLAAKLPACLLRSAVAFFQADLSLNQIYNGLLSQAFAKADLARRQTYLMSLDQEWVSTYQIAAFSALFRLSFYMRLRWWSI